MTACGPSCGTASQLSFALCCPPGTEEVTQRHFFHWFWEGQRASKQRCPGQPGTAQSQHSRARAHWLGRRQEPA